MGFDLSLSHGSADSRSRWTSPLNERQLAHLHAVLREKDFHLQSRESRLLQIAAKADDLIHRVLTAFVTEYSFRASDPIAGALDAWMARHDLSIAVSLKGGLASSLYNEQAVLSGDLDSLISVNRLPHDLANPHDNRSFFRQVAYRAVSGLLDAYHRGSPHDLKADHFFDNLLLFSDNSLFLMSFAGIDFAFPIPSSQGAAVSRVGSTFIHESLKVTIPLSGLRPQVSSECRLTSDFPIDADVLRSLFDQRIICIPEPERIAHNGFERLAYSLSKGWTTLAIGPVQILIDEWMKRAKETTPAVPFERLCHLIVKKKLSKDNALVLLMNAFLLTTCMEPGTHELFSRLFESAFSHPKLVDLLPDEVMGLVTMGMSVNHIYTLGVMEGYLMSENCDFTPRSHLSHSVYLAPLGNSTLMVPIPRLSVLARMRAFDDFFRSISVELRSAVLNRLQRKYSSMSFQDLREVNFLFVYSALRQHAFTAEELEELRALFSDFLRVAASDPTTAAQLRAKEAVVAAASRLGPFFPGNAVKERLFNELLASPLNLSTIYPLYMILNGYINPALLVEHLLSALEKSGDYPLLSPHLIAAIQTLGSHEAIECLEIALSRASFTPFFARHLDPRWLASFPENLFIESSFKERWIELVRFELVKSVASNWAPLALNWVLTKKADALLQDLMFRVELSSTESLSLLRSLLARGLFALIEAWAQKDPSLLTHLSSQELLNTAHHSAQPADYLTPFFTAWAKEGYLEIPYPTAELEKLFTGVKWVSFIDLMRSLMNEATHQALIPLFIRLDATYSLLSRQPLRFVVELTSTWEVLNEALKVALIELLLSSEGGDLDQPRYVEKLMHLIASLDCEDENFFPLLAKVIKKIPQGLVELRKIGRGRALHDYRYLIEQTVRLDWALSSQLPKAWADEVISVTLKAPSNLQEQLLLSKKTGVYLPLNQSIRQSLEKHPRLITVSEFEQITHLFSNYLEGLKTLLDHLEAHRFPYGKDSIFLKVFQLETLAGKTALITRLIQRGTSRSTVHMMCEHWSHEQAVRLLSPQELAGLVESGLELFPDAVLTSLATGLLSRADTSPVIRDRVFRLFSSWPASLQSAVMPLILTHIRVLKDEHLLAFLTEPVYQGSDLLRKPLFAYALTSKQHEQYFIQLIEKLPAPFVKSRKDVLMGLLQPLLEKRLASAEEDPSFWNLMINFAKPMLSKAPSEQLFSAASRLTDGDLVLKLFEIVMQSAEALTLPSLLSLLERFIALPIHRPHRVPLLVNKQTADLFFGRLMTLAPFDQLISLWRDWMGAELLHPELVQHLGFKLMMLGMRSRDDHWMKQLLALPGISSLKKLDERQKSLLIQSVEELHRLDSSPAPMSVFHWLIETGFLVGFHPRWNGIAERLVLQMCSTIQTPSQIFAFLTKWRILSTCMTKMDKKPQQVFQWSDSFQVQLARIFLTAIQRAQFFPAIQLYQNFRATHPVFVDSILSLVKKTDPALLITQVPMMKLPQVETFNAILLGQRYLNSMTHPQKETLKRQLCFMLRKNMEKESSMIQELQGLHETLIYLQREYHPDQDSMINEVFLEAIDYLMNPNHFFVTTDINSVLAALLTIRQCPVKQRKEMLCPENHDRIIAWLPVIWKFMHLTVEETQQAEKGLDRPLMEVYLPACKMVVAIELMTFARELLLFASLDIVYPLLAISKQGINLDSMEEEDRKSFLSNVYELIRSYTGYIPQGYRPTLDGIGVLTPLELFTLSTEMSRDLSLKQMLYLTPDVILSKTCATLDDLLSSFSLLKAMMSYGFAIEPELKPKLGRTLNYLLTNCDLFCVKNFDQVARRWPDIRSQTILFTHEMMTSVGFSEAQNAVLNRLLKGILRNLSKGIPTLEHPLFQDLFRGSTAAQVEKILEPISDLVEIIIEPLDCQLLYLNVLLSGLVYHHQAFGLCSDRIALPVAELFTSIAYRFVLEKRYQLSQDRLRFFQALFPIIEILPERLTEIFLPEVFRVGHAELHSPAPRNPLIRQLMKSLKSFSKKEILLRLYFMIAESPLRGEFPVEAEAESREAAQAAAATAAL